MKLVTMTMLLAEVLLVLAGLLVGESPAMQDAAPKPGDKPPTVENSRGMKFVVLPPGTYRRGFATNDRRENRFHQAHPYSNGQDFKFEKPDHQVTLTAGFQIGVSEVTVGQFRQFVAATGYVTDAEKKAGALGFFPDEKDYVDRFHTDPAVTWKSPGFPQTDDHPVVAVSRNDAVAYCRWLSGEDRATYRLPTEAEWEYACRGGTETWYSWGTDPDEAYRHANVADGALEAAAPETTRYQRAVRLEADQGDGHAFTAPVMSFRANGWGLHDMHGNVWEWCADRWSEDVYRRYFDGLEFRERQKLVVTDPVFLKETDQHKYGDWRVIRGGAWTCAPAAVRCSIRTFAAGDEASVYTGFRVVRVPASKDE